MIIFFLPQDILTRLCPLAVRLIKTSWPENEVSAPAWQVLQHILDRIDGTITPASWNAADGCNMVLRKALTSTLQHKDQSLAASALAKVN